MQFEEEQPRRWELGDSVTVDLDGPTIEFADGSQGGINGEIDFPVLPAAAVRELPLRTLDAALGMIAEDTADARPIDTWLIDTDHPKKVYEVEPIEGIALHTGGEFELCALFHIGLPRYADEAFESRADEILAPMMARLGGKSHSGLHLAEDVFNGEMFALTVEYEHTNGRSVGDLLDMAGSARALLQSARNGDINREVARDLIAAGHGSALVGRPESQWLEAKSQSWNLDTVAGKFELAKDLSAFANAGGGIILMPAKTSGESGEDIISKVGEMPLERFSETQLRDTIEHRIFPPLRGLEIDVINISADRGQIVITIPAHRPEDWPHLVVVDNAITAFVREGAHVRPLTAQELHGHIRAGRLSAGK